MILKKKSSRDDSSASSNNGVYDACTLIYLRKTNICIDRNISKYQYTIKKRHVHESMVTSVATSCKIQRCRVPVR